MVAKDALCSASFDQALHEFDDCWTIWATVGQIADEDESSALGMLPVVAVAKMCEQCQERGILAMNIAPPHRSSSLAWSPVSSRSAATAQATTTRP